jgi:hypothetical protein
VALSSAQRQLYLFTHFSRFFLHALTRVSVFLCRWCCVAFFRLGESKGLISFSRSYEGVSRVDNEITVIATRLEGTQRVMAAELTRLTHKIAIQLLIVAQSCTICSSRSRRPIRKLLDTPSYVNNSFRCDRGSYLSMCSFLRCFSCVARCHLNSNIYFNKKWLRMHGTITPFSHTFSWCAA